MSSQTNGNPIEILLVEDNPGDARLTQEAFRDVEAKINLHLVQDGAEALAYIRKEGKYADVPRPDIILLDLNLPVKDGREVLAEIKEDPGIKSIPVIILTTSKADEDILKTYNLHANCYITKPVDLEKFFTVIRIFKNFWLTFVQLPPK